MPTTPLAPPVGGLALEEAMQLALGNRPELTAIGVNEEITRVDEHFYRDRRRPRIDVVGSYSMAGLAGTPAPAPIR